MLNLIMAQKLDTVHEELIKLLLREKGLIEITGKLTDVVEKLDKRIAALEAKHTQHNTN